MSRRTCQRAGCTSFVHGRGLCNRHYKQATSADPTSTNYRRGTPSERFWRKVTQGAGDQCWHWTAFVDHDGYGMFGITGSHSVRAHRFAYEERHGPIPGGHVIDHDCHNRDPHCPGGRTCTHRLCVRPDHLSATTPTRNVFTSTHTRAAINAARTHCIAGHPLAGDNLYVRPSNGERHCRQCRRDRKRRYRANRQRATAPAA